MIPLHHTLGSRALRASATLSTAALLVLAPHATSAFASPYLADSAPHHWRHRDTTTSTPAPTYPDPTTDDTTTDDSTTDEGTTDEGTTEEGTTEEPQTAPAPTPASSTRGCAARPSSCGYPDATNTGVRGKTLVNVPGQLRSGKGWVWDSRGWLSVTGDGAVLDGLNVTGPINVFASGVVIRNCRVTAAGEDWGIGLNHARNALVEDTTITAPQQYGSSRLMVGIKDVYDDSSGLVLRRNNISRASTGIQVERGVIRDNYIHDFGMTGDDHLNGVTSNGGTASLVIYHNTIFNQSSQTDAIGLFQDFGPQANRVIDDNLLAGGGYTVYAGANNGRWSTATNIKVTGNRFARLYFGSSGEYGPITAFAPTSSGNVFWGNVWDDTGAPLVGDFPTHG